MDIWKLIDLKSCRAQTYLAHMLQAPATSVELELCPLPRLAKVNLYLVGSALSISSSKLHNERCGDANSLGNRCIDSHWGLPGDHQAPGVPNPPVRYQSGKCVTQRPPLPPIQVLSCKEGRIAGRGVCRSGLLRPTTRPSALLPREEMAHLVADAIARRGGPADGGTPRLPENWAIAPN